LTSTSVPFDPAHLPSVFDIDIDAAARRSAAKAGSPAGVTAEAAVTPDLAAAADAASTADAAVRGFATKPTEQTKATLVAASAAEPSADAAAIPSARSSARSTDAAATRPARSADAAAITSAHSAGKAATKPTRSADAAATRPGRSARTAAAEDAVVTQPAKAHTAEAVALSSAKDDGDTTGFAELGVPRRLVQALRKGGFTNPFEIQRATLPDALAGRDVLGRGQTGSGKTLAFGLAVLTRLAEGKPARPHHPRALILVPTRELAMQVADELRPLAKAAGLFLGTAVGGVPYDRQILGLQRGIDLIVATPGRLGDLIEKGACSLEEVEITVLDEADQMADMGFLPDVTQLLAQTPDKAQRLLFSATLDKDVDALVTRFMTDPVTHSTSPAAASVDTMEHMLLLIPPQQKTKITAAIANRSGRTIMFARTQLAVDRIVGQLREAGVRAAGLHGGKTQRVRTATLANFKEGRIGVLVATDVAARGIHVDGISLVVHLDPPKDHKDYLHRAGRTARAGESGAVATLVLPKQRKSTLSMLDRAGVAEPAQHRVRIEDNKLAEVTGAREPSGIPVRDEPTAIRRSAGSGGRPHRRGSDRDPARRSSRR
jgi:superfamily II DNA/RNA helicase